MKRQRAPTYLAPKAGIGFRFGPGLLLVILASVIVWQKMPPTGSRPRIERKTVEVPHASVLSTPEPAWLLAQQDTLGLNEAQRRRLRRLQIRWDRNTQALREALENASTTFAHSMPSSDAGAVVSLQQLKKQAAPVSEWTRQLLAARRAWWSEAATVLTPLQKRQAEQLWSSRFVPR
jgi:hypothetical protein